MQFTGGMIPVGRRYRLVSNARISILLVDDDQAFAEFVRSELDAITPQAEIATALSLETGLLMLKDSAYDVALVSLDPEDPGCLEDLRRLNHAVPQQAIVALIQSDNEEQTVEMLKNGAQEVFCKSARDKQRLDWIIKTALARKLTYERMRRHEHHQREDFVAMLAHDLKTPVSGAKRIFDLLLEGWLGELTPGQSEIIMKLRHNNDELFQLIQNMLEVYQYELSPIPVEQQKVELLPLLADCVLKFDQPAQQKTVHIVSHMPQTLGAVRAELAAIRRLFYHVLDNAIKYSPPGATITLSAKTHGKMAVVSVEDEGPGIPESVRSRLFERFWHGGHDTKYSAATGIGLYLCRRITEIHGGSIACKSQTGKGTTFVIKLPLMPVGKGREMKSKQNLGEGLAPLNE